MLFSQKIKNYSLVSFFILIVCFFSCDANSSKVGKKDKEEKSRIDSSIKTRKEKGLESLNRNIGEKFTMDNYIDTSGTLIKLDFTKSDINIVDIWFNDCPPCNAEMSQFKDLIEGKDKRISIISISLSSFKDWKNLFTNESARYSFLKAKLPNWQHLNLKSNDDPKLHNILSEDRFAELKDKLSVSFFPSYFIINREGVIEARPISAVEYMKNYLKF
jgi:peroxiredoxin